MSVPMNPLLKEIHIFACRKCLIDSFFTSFRRFVFTKDDCSIARVGDRNGGARERNECQWIGMFSPMYCVFFIKLLSSKIRKN